MNRFHFCEKFKKTIDKENYSEDYKNSIYSKIQENSKRKNLKNIGSINLFAGGIYILKISNPKTRIIIEEKNITINENDIKVFFVRDIISNHKFNNIYGKYLYKKLQNREWIDANPLSRADIDGFKQNYNKSKKIKPIKLEFPPHNLINWLNDFKLKLNNEIFETKEWVRYALDNCETTGMLDKKVDTFRIVIEEIIEKKHNIDSQSIKIENNIEILQYTNHNIGILYSKLEIDNKNIILLYNGAILDKQDEYWQKAINNIKNNSINFKEDVENISRNSFRSYPKWTVKDDDLWFAIQKSKEISNLSLTSEQSDFFRNFKFPYYINGQAGSGKSTMLYYLFSNVYFYKAQEEIVGDIVFLTENDKLLENTKRYVYDLLTNNPEFNGLNEEDRVNSKKYFYSFKDFLFNILDENDKKLFKKENYLNFSIFKNLYDNSKLSYNIKEKYSAEESWFTIITYIYGNDINNRVTNEDYEEKVPKASRVISIDKFIGIEKSVLPFYEKLITEEEYWDKLKIIRYIKENVNLDIKNKYSVIICDEAQDFCRVELQFILRMSEYLKYNLSTVEQVPLIFAGDPNQTVNPTGFREDEMTSLLYSELKEIAGFNYNANSNLYNPSINYRSAHPVVSLANFIQYYRMKELGIKQKKPQEAKRPSSDKDRDFNIFLNYKDIESKIDLKNALIKKLEYKIFIVPVDSQEKAGFINSSNLLSNINKVEVKTSVEAKGAEYNQVVLYGFGEYFLDEFGTLDKKLNDDEVFRIGYFFNKLYVGITRAQSELIIIDSVGAQKNFWNKLVDNIEITNTQWDILKDLKSKTIVYNSDSINSVLESTPINALLNAKQDKKQGEYHSNPARLRVASNQFFKLGEDKEANECLALAEGIKKNYKSAGEYYLKSENIEKASMCFFKGRYFDDVEKIGNNLTTLEQDICMIIARVMDREMLISKEIDILSTNKTILYFLIKNLDWRDELIKNFLIILKKLEEIELKRELVEMLNHIVLSTDTDLQKKIATIYYDLEEYQKAVNIWETIDDYINNKSYYVSKLQLARVQKDNIEIVSWLDANLEFENRIEQNSIFAEIVEIYKNNNIDMDNELLLIIYKAYLNVETESSIIDIGIIVEREYQNNLVALKEFYQIIIENEEINKTVYLYVLERWAKVYWKMNENSIEELNNIYKKINKDIPYKEFSRSELEKIPNLPIIQDKNNIEHFFNIRIEKFRQFENIELNNIGQFNLILGDNNVGKTSLLEALLFTTDKDLYFKNLILSYASRINSLDFKNQNDFILDIFNNNLDTQEFEFKLRNNRKEQIYKIKIPTENEIKNKYKITEDIDRTKYISIVSGEMSDIYTVSLFLEKMKSTDLIQTQFIPYGKGFDKDLVKSYAENIDRNKEKRKDFLESMRVFIPNIDRITTDTDEGKIYIEELNSPHDASLHQYGEGSKKLFRILVQITLQKEKKLLIDEIDAGIHHSHFNEFWKVILKVAKANNVQIFATTHNMECIEYFKEVLEEDEMQIYQDLSRTITLRELPNHTIKAYTRIFEEFEYEIDNELEIRGEKL